MRKKMSNVSIDFAFLFCSLVVLGGDGSVIQSINALIQMEATETRSE